MTRKSVAQYKETRRVVLAELAAPIGDADGSRFFELGRQFGEAFNRLAGRTPFIETDEREELYDAIDAIVNDAEVEYGRSQHLIAGVDSARDW